jgi:hypothetical protein
VALVVTQDEFGSVAEKGYVFDEIEADLRVALHVFSEAHGCRLNGVLHDLRWAFHTRQPDLKSALQFAPC